MKDSISRLRDMARIDLMFFFTSFFMSGTQSIITQLFFVTYYPARKYELLSMTLVFGALATLAGLAAGAKLQHTRRRILLPLFVLLGVAAFALQMLSHTMAQYLPAFLLASFSINLLYNVLDNFFMRVVAQPAQPLHIKTLLLYQMLGYILSPLFFSLFAQQKGLLITVVAILGIISYAAPLRLHRQTTPETEAGSMPEEKRGRPLAPRDRLFLTYVLVVFSGIYVFLAIAEYLLRDYYRFDNSAWICSLFLMAVVLISGGVIALSGNGKSLFGTALQSLALVLIALSAVLLWLRLSTRPVYLVLPCLFLGIGNGLFTSHTKRYANCCERSARVISLYNIIQTGASLCAYAAVYLASRMAVASGQDANVLCLLLIALLMVIAAIIIQFITRTERREI